MKERGKESSTRARVNTLLHLVRSALLSRRANGRTALRRFVFHFGLIYCTRATLAIRRTAIPDSARHSTTPHPTNVPHKTWYQRSSNGDLQSLQALCPVTINSLGRRRYISSANTFVPNGYPVAVFYTLPIETRPPPCDSSFIYRSANPNYSLRKKFHFD